jgi:hypothetical protein
MAIFDDFLNALKDGLKQLVTNTVQDFSQAATIDGRAFLDKVRADLERWTNALAHGQLSKEDFAFLVQGKKDLVEMEALKQAGLALVRLDQFRSSLIELVVGTAFKVFL